ncbi:hypothetical protein RZS08_21220 [Arthrospira platensis SPKY1]|nr:hypothetical protein [Arthrospira platensis SPKY1]
MEQKDKPKAGRMGVRMPENRIEIMKRAAEEAGISYTQFFGMCAWMGYKSYQRQVNPEELFTVEQLVEMAKIAERDRISSGENSL